MKKQIRRFGCAVRGIWHTVKSEAHMRFHLVAGFYVILFSFFYNFTPAQWAVLILLIASVLAAETLNTCIEQLCNLVADRFEPLVKFAKDAAAGAVLILAAASAVTAIIFFSDADVIIRIVGFFAESPVLIVLLAASVLLSVVFIRLGPVGIKSKMRKMRRNAARNSRR